MTSMRLPEEMELKLSALAQATRRSKSFFIREALERYFDDMEDAYISLERITKSKRKFHDSAAVKKAIKSQS